MATIRVNADAVKKVRMHTANFFTLISACTGTAALLVCSQGQLFLSAVLILSSAIIDRFDGKIARRLKIESEFGKQLDSLCDIISFGVAPALLVYQGIFYHFGIFGLLISIFYVVCGIIRLARFNVGNQKEFFIGLPITAAGVVSAVCFFSSPFLPPFWIFLIFFIAAFLMISPYRFKKI